MPEPGKNVLKARADSHSDVASTPAAKAHQTEMVERQLGNILVRRLREAKGPITLSNFQEEWHGTDDGAVLELTVDAESEPEAA